MLVLIMISAREEKTLVIDAEGMVLLPGLIDGHTHAISNRVRDRRIHKACDSLRCHDGGYRDDRAMHRLWEKTASNIVVKGLEEQPIRFYYTLPALCGLTLSEEIIAPANEELLPFLKDPKCLGIGEIYWSNIFLEGRQGERVRELASMALDLGKRVEGTRRRSESGRKLQAYTCFGISSDHEPITEEEVSGKAEAGILGDDQRRIRQKGTDRSQRDFR